ncbi:MAG: hypothetical protein ACLFMX_02130 [Halobacteriales archaeon]
MPKTPEPTRVVADADVLVADLFVDGEARAAMDVVRSHTWFELYASEELLETASAAVGELSETSLADDWLDRVRAEATLVDHPAGDTPALATAYRANAGHVVTYDARLRSAATGVRMRRAMPLSVRHPRAFVDRVDPAVVYELAMDAPYPGPDVDPRS